MSFSDKVTTVDFLKSLLIYYFEDKKILLNEDDFKYLDDDFKKIAIYEDDPQLIHAEFWLIVEKWLTPRQCTAFSKFALNIVANPDVLLKKKGNRNG